MITNIRQDAGYFCGKAMLAFENRNYIESIKQLNKAEKVAIGGEKLEIYFILGLMYNCIEDYDRSSEYFMLSIISRPLQIKAIRSMFDNAVTQKDIVQAFNFKNLFNFTDVDKKEKEAVEKIYEQLKKDLKPKIREVKIEESEQFQKDFEQALDLFEDEQFEDVIEILKKYDYKKSQDVRDLLADCYFMSDRSDEAIDMLSSQDMTLCDKISMLVCLDDLEREEEKQQIIQEIKKSKMTESDLFKFALALLKAGEQIVCVEILEKYLKLRPYDINASNLYCSTCISLGLFSKAKDKLLELKEIAQFEGIYYLEMLKMCENKESKKIFDCISLWKSFDKKYKAKLKSILNLEDKEFENAIIKDENFINWVAIIKDKYLRNMFFARVSKIRGIKDTLQKLLVSSQVDFTTKQIIVSTRLDMGYNEDFLIMRNGLLVGVAPLALRYKKNEMFYKAYCLVVNRVIVDNAQQWFYNITYFFDNLKEICKEDIEDPYILASILSWEFERFRGGKIKNICKYYNVKEEDFWKYYISSD